MQNVPRKGNTSVRLKRYGLKGIALIIFCQPQKPHTPTVRTNKKY